MKKIYAGIVFLLAMVCLSTVVQGKEQVHWDYSATGHEGPENWGTLDPSYSMCAEGKNQSPVDLAGMVESDLPFITVDYQAGGNEILNNGHTIQVNYKPGSTISVTGNQYELKQFHFHTPSENIVNGNAWPLEAHFVHADTNGNLAVIAVMFRTGETNSELEKAWGVMPENAGEKDLLAVLVDANLLLPEDRDYYRFNGSLTTPPCSEGVLWLVMKNDNAASVDQIEKFAHLMHHPNNRPIQPRNSRLIMK